MSAIEQVKTLSERVGVYFGQCPEFLEDYLLLRPEALED